MYLSIGYTRTYKCDDDCYVARIQLASSHVDRPHSYGERRYLHKSCDNDQGNDVYFSVPNVADIESDASCDFFEM